MGVCVNILIGLFFLGVIIESQCQRSTGLPFTWGSLRMIGRYKTPIPSGRSFASSDIKMRLYSNNFTDPATVYLGESTKLLSDPRFDPKKPTVLYAHGYLEVWDDYSVQLIVDAYRAVGTHNILVPDFSNLVYGFYSFAVSHVVEISTELSKALLEMFNEGLDADTLHLLGHSMGAHILGLVARQVDEKGFRMKRLTALDPAYPLFYTSFLTLAPHMASTDADFVDVIHTDGGGYGAPQTLGTVDFWPNEGIGKQPGCPGGPIIFTTEDFCSHWRSYEFWAEALRGGKFIAKKCKDYDEFLRGACKPSELNLMGPKANTELRGNFYLRTGTKRPYALAEHGIL